MRLVSLIAALGAGSLAIASVHAQQANVPPANADAATASSADVAPTGAAPPAPAPLAQPVPSDEPVKVNSFVAPDGQQHVLVQLPPVVQAVPPPAGVYPLCVKGRRDSCRNPGEG